MVQTADGFQCFPFYIINIKEKQHTSTTAYTAYCPSAGFWKLASQIKVCFSKVGLKEIEAKKTQVMSVRVTAQHHDKRKVTV